MGWLPAKHNIFCGDGGVSFGIGSDDH